MSFTYPPLIGGYIFIMKSIGIFLLIFLASCNGAEVYYQGKPVKIISEDCSYNYPHTCYSVVELDSGQKLRVNSEELKGD